MMSSTNAARTLPGRRMVLIKKPNRNRAATASGAIKMERFSHNSRRTDQYIGRVADMTAGATPWESKDSGTALE